MKGGRLPDGYKLFIAPKYVLAHDSGTQIRLTDAMGEILSIIVGARGGPVTRSEIANAMYDHRDGCAPLWAENVISVQIHQMRKRLKAGGIEVIVQSIGGTDGYRFRGFRLCERTSDRFVKTRRRLSAEEAERCRAAREAPWAFHTRHLSHDRARRA
jgi:hypothetical protein